MLLLFESAAGFALFKADDKVLKAAETEDVWKHFETPEAAAKVRGGLGGGRGAWTNRPA